MNRAIDPITLEDLRSKSDQVGALVYGGHRVEQALYHRCSVLDKDGTLILRNGCSPVTHEPVDGFRLAPAFSDLERFVHFLDWNGDGWLSVAEVATALAALLPVDEEGTEHFIRDHFDVDQDGLIAEEELQQQMTPYCGERLAELLLAAPIEEVPELRRGSGREELLRWFDHWDTHGSGGLDFRDLRFALTWAMFHALGDSVDAPTKETVSSLFLAAVDLSGNGHVSRDDFVELFAPALQANLPELQRPEAGLVQRPAPERQQLRLVLHAPVEGTGYPVQVSALSTVADLHATASAKWPHQGGLMLYLEGQPLGNGRQQLHELRALCPGAVVQVLPVQPSAASGCAVS